MERISILGEETIAIGEDITIDLTNELTLLMSPSFYIIITDTNLKRHNHLHHLQTQLAQSLVLNSKLSTIITLALPPGESIKTRETKSFVENWLLDNKCTRDSCFIALGGGVIGDLVGTLICKYIHIYSSSLTYALPLLSLYHSVTIKLFHSIYLLLYSSYTLLLYSSFTLLLYSSFTLLLYSSLHSWQHLTINPFKSLIQWQDSSHQLSWEAAMSFKYQPLYSQWSILQSVVKLQSIQTTERILLVHFINQNEFSSI